MTFDDNPADDRLQLDQCINEIKRLKIINEDLLAACEAVLIFHQGGEWTAADAGRWKFITDKDDATTRVLCDTVRAAIAKSKSSGG